MDQTFSNKIRANEAKLELVTIKNLKRNVLLVKDASNKLFAEKMFTLSNDLKRNNQAYDEIDIIRRANHENILKYYGQYNQHNSLYLITEYCEDGDLGQVIEHYKRNNIFFPEEKIFYTFIQFMDGLSYIHNELKVIHKDLKPGNLFIKNDTVKIGDFGISRTIEGNTEATRGEGTFFYMSPELFQANTNKDYDCKTDIWSAACILYEMVTLKRAFEVINFYSLRELIVDGKEPELENNFLLGSILNKMFQKDKNLRISSESLHLKLKEIFNEKQSRDKKLSQQFLDNLVIRKKGFFNNNKYMFANRLDSNSKVVLVEECKTKERRLLKAIKNINDDDERSAFLSDLNKIKKLNSPYIVKFYEHYDELGFLYTISEYCVHGDLNEYLLDKKSLPLDQVIRISKQMLRGLHDLHSINVLHRNLKPSNIFMSTDRVKIGDILPNIFLKYSTFTSNGMGVIPNYKSPETIQGQKYTNRSDIWSIGCIMFECLKLKKAFQESTPHLTSNNIIEFDPIQGADLDERIKPIIEKMLKKNSEERYGSALEIINELEKIECDEKNEEEQIQLKNIIGINENSQNKNENMDID